MTDSEPDVTVVAAGMAEPLANGSQSAQKDDDDALARAELAKNSANADFKGKAEFRKVLKSTTLGK